jgi:hypothetical protein
MGKNIIVCDASMKIALCEARALFVVDNDNAQFDKGGNVVRDSTGRILCAGIDENMLKCYD